MQVRNLSDNVDPTDPTDAESSAAVDPGLFAESDGAASEVGTIASADSADALSTASYVAPMSEPQASTPLAPRTAAVDVVSAVASTGLRPQAEPGPQAPVQAPVMLAALAAVRDELERNTLRSNANMATPPVPSLAADLSPNVLVIGVDGTNLSRVLADPTNANFFELIQDGTTAASSIVGHTTISGPSWSSILTGDRKSVV